jgi:hypothetical protein
MSHVDVISDILSAALKAYPESDFVQSLSHQYLVRGSLSKRQLEGLYKKAERIQGLPPNKLATLEAIILKRPKKYKSALPASEPLFKKDEASAKMIEDILRLYPQHKRVLFFDARCRNNETLSPTEATELAKFHKLLIK